MGGQAGVQAGGTRAPAARRTRGLALAPEGDTDFPAAAPSPAEEGARRTEMLHEGEELLARDLAALELGLFGGGGPV